MIATEVETEDQVRAERHVVAPRYGRQAGLSKRGRWQSAFLF